MYLSEEKGRTYLKESIYINSRIIIIVKKVVFDESGLLEDKLKNAEKKK
jgi:hypothetical protein